MEPILSGAAKGLLTIAGPLLKTAKEQWYRRDAGTVPVDPATMDSELTEALALLLSEEQTSGAAIKTWAKAQLSGRPQEFDEPHVKDWLRKNEVEQLLKRAARQYVLEQPIDALREQAANAFNAQSGDYAWYGGALFDTAVAFLVLTVHSKLSPADRIVADVVKSTGRRLEAKFERFEDSFSAQLTDLGAKVEAAGDEFPIEILVDYLRRFTDRESRLRGMVDPTRVDRVLGIAGKALDGAFRKAPDAERASVFRLAAATLAREGRTSEAGPWIDAAGRLGTNDLAPDRARIALLANDAAQALELLRDREDTVSVSLALDALQSRDGRSAAVAFYRDHLTPDRLSGFGLSNAAIWTALEGDWEGAGRLIDAASPDQISENPLLLLVRARFRIATMLPEARRADLIEVVGGLPPRGLLRDDNEGEELRVRAISDLDELGHQATELRHSGLADLVDSHRLYLQLTSNDPKVRCTAESELARRLEDPSAGASWASLALLLEVHFDDAPLRSRLAKSKSLGGFSPEELLAAAQLAMRDRDPDAILAFVNENRDRLAAEMTADLAFGLEIEVLARKGRLEEARAKLELARERLGPDIAARLVALIAEEAGEDGISLRLTAYERTLSDRDLDLLVDALVARQDPRAGDYAVELWRVRRRVEDAITACNAYHNSGADEKLDAFLEELADLVSSNLRLREHLAWSHFRGGRLIEAQGLIAALRIDEPDRGSLRQLEINVAIEGGDWHRLGPLVRQDLDRQNDRSVLQLTQAAGLAHAASDPLADELARAAVAKSPDDPHVLLAAFSIATRRGWDWEPEAGSWLRRAIELSGESGPLERRDLRDVVRYRQEGEKRARDLDRLIMAGEVPLGIAVRPLNTSLSELILARLAFNVGVRDARRRLCLPLIAGNRQTWDISRFKRIGLDPAAIMTLQLVGLLDEAIDGLPHVVLPAGTFPLLLSDLERATRGQPSRTAQAVKIKGMIADGRIQVYPEMPVDAVDEGYARAVAINALFVHTSPIFEPGSFMEERRDVSPFESRLVSPQSVVQALRLTGEITAAEQGQAVAALEATGPMWPSEPAVDLDRGLVVDGGALYLLDHVGMLDRLVHAGIGLHVSSVVVDLADASIAEDQSSREIERSIERVRATLHGAIAKGQASFGSLRRVPHDLEDGAGKGEVDRGDAEVAPLLSMLRDGSGVDLLVSGERVVNRHGEFTDGVGTSRPVGTPWDVLEHLLRIGRIDADRLAAAKRRLRESGVALIPVIAEELVEACCETDWSRGAGRGLKAICQSVGLALARRAIALPTDVPWLASLPIQFAHAIRMCWTDAKSVEDARSAAEFLFLNLPDVEGYAVVEAGPDGRAWVYNELLMSYLLLANPLSVPKERREAYADWHEAQVEQRLFARDAAMVPELVGRLEDMLTSREAVSSDGVEVTAVEIARHIASGLPRAYLNRLVSKPKVRASLGLRERSLNLEGHDVGAAAIGKFLALVVAGGDAMLTDLDGKVVATNGTQTASGGVAIELNGTRLVFAEAQVFSDEATDRVAALDSMLSCRTLSPTLERRWRALVEKQVPTSEQFLEMIEDLGRTPEAFVEHLHMQQGGLEFRALASDDRCYYANLIGVDGEAGNLTQILNGITNGHRELGMTPNRLLALAPLAVAQGLRFDQLASDLSDDAAAPLAFRLLEEGDPFSAIAAFELSSSRAADAGCRAAATSILDRLVGEGTFLEDISHGFCVGALVATQSLDHSHVINDWPLAARRLAAMAHAGHVARVLHQTQIDRIAAWNQVSVSVGPAWHLAGLLERIDDGVWLREWLEPSIVSACVLHRLGVAVSRLAEADRPADWLDRISKATGVGNPLIHIAGPMDGLDEGATALPKRDADAVIAQLERAEPNMLLSYLEGLLTELKPPSDSEAIFDVLVMRAKAIVGEERDQLIEHLLRVAARWRLHSLADRIWDVTWDIREEAGFGPTKLVSIAIASAAARSGKQAADRSEELLVLVASALPQSDLRQLVGALNMLTTTAEWGRSFRRAMTIALLGVGGPVK